MVTGFCDGQGSCPRVFPNTPQIQITYLNVYIGIEIL